MREADGTGRRRAATVDAPDGHTAEALSAAADGSGSRSGV